MRNACAAHHGDHSPRAATVHSLHCGGFFMLFPEQRWGPSTNFHAEWLDWRGFTQRCALWSKKIFHVAKIKYGTQRFGLGPVLDPIVRRRSSLFGHVARLPEDTPAHQALQCHIDLSLGRLPDPSWSRSPSKQVAWPTPQGQRYTLPANLWRRAVTRGHYGERRGLKIASFFQTPTTRPENANSLPDVLRRLSMKWSDIRIGRTPRHVSITSRTLTSSAQTPDVMWSLCTSGSLAFVSV